MIVLLLTNSNNKRLNNIVTNFSYNNKQLISIITNFSNNNTITIINLII